MRISDLTHIEQLAYEAGRADERAQRWRIEAEIAERRGESDDSARQYEAEYQADAADLWRRLAKAKGRGGAE